MAEQTIAPIQSMAPNMSAAPQMTMANQSVGGPATVPAPAVVTAAPAISQVNNVQAAMTQAKSDMTAQTQAKAAQAKATADAVAQEKANQDALNAKYAANPQNALAISQESAKTGQSPEEIAKRVTELMGGTTSPTTPNPPGSPQAPATTEPSTTPTPQDQYKSEVDKNNAALDQAGQTLNDQIAQIQNGTFPLTPSQQAMVDALKAATTRSVNAQKLANQNYEGGTNQLNIVSGRNRYAPEIALGNYQNAVNVGITKINDIEQQGAKAVADMEQAFMDKDYKMATDAYDRFVNSTKDKNAQIQHLADQAQSYEEFTKNYERQTAQDAVSNKLASDEFTYKQKQDAFNNAMASDKFTAEQKKQIHDQYIADEELKLKQQAAGLNSDNTPRPVVSMSSQGIPDKGQQKEFLASLPTDMQTTIKGLADYSIDPNNFSTRSGMTRSQVVSIAKQFDPTYNEGQYAIRNKFQNEFNAPNSQPQVSKVAINTAISHLGELQKAGEALQNISGGGFLGIGTHTYNDLSQLLSEQSGNPQVSNFQFILNGVASEIAKGLKGGAPGETDVKNVMDSLTKGSSPQQINGVIQTAISMIGDKLGTTSQQYRDVMGKAPPAMLNDAQRQVLYDLKAKGLNVDPQQIDPLTQWKDPASYIQDNPDKKAQVDQWRAQGLSPSDVMDIINNNASDSGSGNPNNDLSTSQNGSIGMRTDRNNNPTAMTTDVAKAGGLVEGVDFIKGDSFANGKYNTAKLIGDPVDKTIKAIDKMGFQTASGQPRWTYINMPKSQWDALDKNGKRQVIATMYKNEGGSKLKSLLS